VSGEELSTELAWYALHEPLQNFIRKRVSDESIVEDLLQDIFLKIHTHIDQLKEGEKLEGWVYQIARNRIIDYYRSRTTGISLEEAALQLPTVELPEEDIHAQLVPAMMAMLLSLPAPYREALYLTDYKGLSQKELARRAGISLSGAKSRVQRAREKLKQLLLDCCHFEFDSFGHLINYQSRRGCCDSQTNNGSPQMTSLPLITLADRKNI
jgi:RNA polymerase sigma-70 factor, ECF subfamily